MRKATGWIWGPAVVAALICASPVYATPIEITVDTSSLNGTAGAFAFDLIDGGPPANSVTISNFTTDGALGAPTPQGDVNGTLPGTVTLGDSSFFNEYLQNITLGNTLHFEIDTTGNAPDPLSFPDAFSFFLLDPITGSSLVTTSDPTGANALFLWNIGVSSIPDVYTGNQFSVTATPVSVVPEPSTAVLIAISLSVMLLVFVVAKRFTHPRPAL
jgi:hypothetical protein